MSIRTCDRCGGLYSDLGNEMIAGSPCRCTSPLVASVAMTTPQPPEPPQWAKDAAKELIDIAPGLLVGTHRNLHKEYSELIARHAQAGHDETRRLLEDIANAWDAQDGTAKADLACADIVQRIRAHLETNK